MICKLIYYNDYEVVEHEMNLETAILCIEYLKKYKLKFSKDKKFSHIICEIDWFGIIEYIDNDMCFSDYPYNFLE